jgi:hypothetical protein
VIQRDPDVDSMRVDLPGRAAVLWRERSIVAIWDVGEGAPFVLVQIGTEGSRCAIAPVLSDGATEPDNGDNGQPSLSRRVNERVRRSGKTIVGRAECETHTGAVKGYI